MADRPACSATHHVRIWALDVGSRLGATTRRRLARATSGSAGQPCVSAVSVFEVVALHAAGRLQLDRPVERWIRDSIERGGLRLLDYSKHTGLARTVDASR